jgi:hypothetical protein
MAVAIDGNLSLGLTTVKWLAGLGRQTFIFTTMREPIARLESLWSFSYLQRETNPLWNDLQAAGPGLAAILRSSLAPRFVNPVCRFILDEPQRNDATPVSLADHARDRLRRHQVAVLDTSDLSTMLPTLFADRWRPDWAVPTFNQSSYEVPPLARGGSEFDLLRESNRADILLYESLTTERG